MAQPEVTQLSKMVNAEARQRYAEVSRLLGERSLLAAVAPRVALRHNTNYPYAFTEDTQLVPAQVPAFGRVIRRSREAGLREIHTSIATQTQEHSWLYIPMTSLWVDTTVAAHDASVDVDDYAHIYLSHLFPEIEMVHTHPDPVVRALANESPWMYSDNYTLEAALPSQYDLLGHAYLRSRTAPSCQTPSSVVSHFGVTTFSATAMDGQEGALFTMHDYSRLIAEPTAEPVARIEAALGKLTAHALHYDGTPAFDFNFEPLTD
ncbi:MAG TPA: hypothetical protein VLF91_00375 [Candidatus Saccharimonadales bacterium]|nr:hypothetical protein [Candidatus Saccharimonadales bacterium]